MSPELRAGSGVEFPLSPSGAPSESPACRTPFENETHGC